MASTADAAAGAGHDFDEVVAGLFAFDDLLDDRLGVL